MSKETTQSLEESHKGSCLCGAVQFEVRGALDSVIACHCTQCRKTSGHYVAATAAKLENFTVVEERGLQWYRSSEFAQRGFCQYCGSSLFWKHDERESISICAGTLDGITGLSTVLHIGLNDAGDYYAIPPHEPGIGDYDVSRAGVTVNR